MAAYIKITELLYMGASTDTKPTGVPIGTKCIEYTVASNTAKEYMTADGTNWRELSTIIIIGAGTSLVGKVGIDQATANANEVVVKSALPTGTNRIGTTSGVLVKSTDSKTLVADGNYLANDVLSESKTAGLVWTFTNVARAVGAGGYIVRAHIMFSKNGGITAITPTTTLFLFSALPTSMLNDNEPNTAVLDADKASYIGKIDFPALSNIGGSPEAVCTPSTPGNLPIAFLCGAALTSIYGILVITTAETAETAATIVTITLEAEQY